MRVVSVKLTADASGLVAAFAQGSAAAQAFAARASSAVARNEAGLNTLSRTAGLLGLAVAAGVGLAVKSFADFDSAMSSVAATGGEARAALGELRSAAIQAGEDTKFSATEAAGGIEALAKAGVSVKDVLGGGLTGALNLAAAGNLGVADSAETAASAMTQFGLAGRDVPHIADLLAQAAGVAQGEVSDMAAALKQSGLVASQFGLSIDETAQTLALFAKNGLIGSDAGTSFKTMLLSLASPSSQAADEMERLGIAAYDANGNFVGISSLAEQLKTRLAGVSDAERDAALSIIFGNDAIRAANVLYKEGATGLAGMGREFAAFGSAADVAAIKMDNLKGDLELLKGSFETALIGLGESSGGPLRSLTQGATDAVNAFNDLGTGTKGALLATGAALATIALSAAGLGKIAIFANNAKQALSALGVTAKGASIAVAGVGAIIGVAAIAFGAYASHAAASRARVEDFTAALQSQTDALQENVTKVATKQLQDAGALGAARSLGVSLQDVTAAALGNADAMERVAVATEAAFAAGLNSADVDVLARVDAARVLSDAVGRTGSEYNKAVGAARDFAEASGEAATSAQPDAYTAAAAGLAQIGTDAGNAAASLSDLASALFEASNAALAASNAEIAYEQAVDAAAEAIKENGKNLKLSTEAGQANQTALNNLAATGQRYVEGLVAQGKGAKEVAAATKEARVNFIETAVAMGASKKAAGELADEYGLIPKKVGTDVEANTGKSEAALAAVKASIKGLPKKVQAEIIAAYNKGGATAAKAELDRIAKIKAKPKIEVDSNAPRISAESSRRIREVKDGKPKINVTTNAAAVASSARSAMAIPDTSATIRINTIKTNISSSPRELRGKKRAFGGPVLGYSPHDRADNILVAATAGEFMQDVPAVRYWGHEFMNAVLARDKAAVQALASAPRLAFGGPVYAQPQMQYALANAAPVYGGRPVVVQQTFPASGDPMAAAAASGGRINDVLDANGGW